MEKELRKLLKKLPRHYDDFETAMVLLVGKNKKAMDLLIKYLKDNPLATVSEVGNMLIALATSDDYEENYQKINPGHLLGVLFMQN